MVVQNKDKEIAKKIGRTIAEYRQATGLTQAQVAEILDISNDAVSRMERGDIMPSVIRLMQFAEVFNCKTADFIIPNSYCINDQAERINQLLLTLKTDDREDLINIIERMIIWYSKKNEK
ncbi:MAG: helix-turn-helix transcriptional regulator [Pasteurella sp.]|nr:helix-turn-helix transcriptional regulator [Pasteurella sp.]